MGDDLMFLVEKRRLIDIINGFRDDLRIERAALAALRAENQRLTTAATDVVTEINEALHLLCRGASAEATLKAARQRLAAALAQNPIAHEQSPPPERNDG